MLWTGAYLGKGLLQFSDTLFQMGDLLLCLRITLRFKATIYVGVIMVYQMGASLRYSF